MPAGAGPGTGSGRWARWAGDPLVGRDDLLAELAAIAHGAAAGAGAVAVLEGEAGIGKTTVVRALTRSSRERMAVTWGSCLADGGAPPLWPWRELLDGGAGAGVRPTGGEVDDDAIGARRLERLQVLSDRIRGLTAGGPRLHVIEDLQWADVASVLLLDRLATSIADVALLVVATVRSGEPRSAELERAIEEVRRGATVRQVVGLDAVAIRHLLRASGDAPDDALVDLIERRTGGNPLLASELLRAVPKGPAERRQALLESSVPERVAELVQHRLGRLPPAVVEVLVTASVLGVAGHVSTLARVDERAADEVLDLLEQARAAHVLDAAPPGSWRFRHALVRDAVYETTSPGERARRHARVLDVLAASSAPAALLAHHALAAQPLLDAGRAVALAARAGEAAFAEHAYEEAVGWFERALSAAPATTPPRWRAELSVLQGEAHRHLGAVDEARAAFAAAADTDDPALLARAALGYADPGSDLGIAYRIEDAATADLLERALAAQPDLDSLPGVQLEARLGAFLYFSDEPERGRTLAVQALGRARALGEPRALVAASAPFHDGMVVGQAPLDDQLRGSAELLAWAREAGSAAALLTARRARAIDLLAAGDVVGLDEQIVAFTRIAEPLRTPAYLWWPALWGAMRALLDGRHDDAEARAVDAYTTAASTFGSLAMLNLSFLLFFLRREQGRLAEMEQATRDYAASRADIPALQVGLALLLAETQRHDEARALLSTFDAPALARLRDRNWPASWFQLARGAYLTGDATVATALLQPGVAPTERCAQVSLATVCLGATDLAAAWLHHTTGDLDEAVERYRGAAALNARIGARSWLAQARFDLAAALDVRGAAGDAPEAARVRLLARGAAAEIGLATLTQPAPIEPTARPATTAPSPPPTATFRPDGTGWRVAFAGIEVHLADARGMADLAYLLSRQGEAVPALELAGDDRGAARGAPTLDERARREIRARLRALDTEEADADAAGDTLRAALAREQRQLLAETVARDVGLGGRARLVGDPVERARKTVSTRLRRTIATIGRAHPQLGRHLERSIDTGAWCAYRPPEPHDWQTS